MGEVTIYHRIPLLSHYKITQVISYTYKATQVYTQVADKYIMVLDALFSFDPLFYTSVNILECNRTATQVYQRENLILVKTNNTSLRHGLKLFHCLVLIQLAIQYKAY